ncbi:MAG TPA: MFS transporter, partial [Acidimicrobiia bacterium]|nr:MFS transporter [Acidimicrobiia bacterium]
YVEGPLGGGDVEVGIAVGALFVGAVLLRPFAGRVGDRVGRRILIIGGAGIVAVSTACYGLVASIPFLVCARVATGVGEAAFFVGAATMITDLAPESRRGEAVSYWSVAVYGGLAFGPALGELVLRNHHYVDAWLVSATLALVASVLGWFTRDVARLDAPAGPRPKLLNRAALAPGVVLMLGLVGLAGYTEFLPLYVKELGTGGAQTIFLLYGGVILTVRIAGARLPDRLGGARAATLALLVGGIGLGLMAAWGTLTGLVVATIVFALGMSLLYPACLLMSLAGISERERGSVVGTVSSFFDLSQGLGAPMLGVVAAVAGYRGAFAAGGMAAFAGLVVLRIGPRRVGATPNVAMIDAESGVGI